jgi:hypothetical protein
MTYIRTLTQKATALINMSELYEISGSHSGEDVDVGLLGCNVEG